VFHLLNSTVFIGILLAGLLSIPLLLLKRNYPVSARVLTISFSFALSLIALLAFYGVSYHERHRPESRPALRFLPEFFLFLSITMGLSLHNSIAVLEGYLGIKTPFVRTPKFNLRENRDSWKNSPYAVRKLALSTWLEGILCLYFVSGIFLGFYLHDYVMLPFHIMLSLGFGLVCFYSIKHSH
jgi:hypothetical protein